MEGVADRHISFQQDTVIQSSNTNLIRTLCPVDPPSHPLTIWLAPRAVNIIGYRTSSKPIIYTQSTTAPQPCISNLEFFVGKNTYTFDHFYRLTPNRFN